MNSENLKNIDNVNGIITLAEITIRKPYCSFFDFFGLSGFLVQVRLVQVCQGLDVDWPLQPLKLLNNIMLVLSLADATEQI
jgi:hypothetical protein